jgi:hypothetical protein
MAAKWSLVCLTCLQALRLGQFVTIDRDGSPVPPSFKGFRNEWGGRWIGGPELLESVQRFLALHLGHELGTVENDVIIDALEPWEMGEEPFRWVENAEDLLDAEGPVPEIDDMADTPAARELAARLRRLAERGSG